MTKEERIVRYLELTAEIFSYSTSRLQEEMNVTDADIEELRKKMEGSLSMRPARKRDLVVRQVIKPLLKKYGFSTGGLDWRLRLRAQYGGY